MLKELEQGIVNECKEWGFGAYLQWAWFEYPDLREMIEVKNYPQRDRLNIAIQKMDEERFAFDDIYLFLLPTKQENPLLLEQEAWRLLSPCVGQHIDDFRIFIASYFPQKTEQKPLVDQINTGWSLLQQWNLISQSYKAKYGKDWDNIKEREGAVRDLIQKLQQRS